jgi:hypothetical protein
MCLAVGVVWLVGGWVGGWVGAFTFFTVNLKMVLFLCLCQTSHGPVQTCGLAVEGLCIMLQLCVHDCV